MKKLAWIALGVTAVAVAVVLLSGREPQDLWDQVLDEI